ncbi:class I SAM-dependent methyltransferase [Myroides marinus]|uniref:Predicted O-methyltransferase YrrM n=1 Tax=Myroides marinus TaxID=703342 RepID=A0A1H6V0V4_9FLAO|nr:class I SAM-dependent methyltransferase [Myroides marinus]KUF43630.1 methyltransferase [Myroides marinus]MDM1347365.1 class I SAM-dependent methyltransferase [Myroides marinus]MDM1349752.1 class I SAM-dependent methyltransferase [Myroides marinus]MDM1353692.1 class I SAM-dependent methyltransferase [Myroides marinus]MDM1356961.1 class I SAM-dependent methyltransferase [Myroides marinus]
MDIQLKKAFLALYDTFKSEDAQKTDRLDKWRNIEPESAEFLSLLIKTKNAKKILELGTSNGFSTLWLAEAVSHNQGEIISIDIERDRTNKAFENLKQFELQSYVELLTYDAGQYLADTTLDFDLILLDAERSYYTGYWKDLERLLDQSESSILVVDNVISHEADVEEFIAMIDERKFKKVVLPIGAGLLLVCKE